MNLLGGAKLSKWLESTLSRATKLDQARLVDRVVVFYRKIPQKIPGQPQAKHNLTLIILAAGRSEEILSLFKLALKENLCPLKIG